MVEVIRAFCWHQKFVPKGFSVLTPWLYIYRIIKNVYKIRCRRDHFKTCNILAKGKGLPIVIKIWSQMDCLPLPGAICIWWNMKKKLYWNQTSKQFFLNLQQMGKVIRAFCWQLKFVPKGLSLCPCPGAIDIYKIIKNVYKIKFLSLNLQWIGKVKRAFCWHQKFVPKGLYALAPGLYTCIKSLKCV